MNVGKLNTVDNNVFKKDLFKKTELDCTGCGSKKATPLKGLTKDTFQLSGK